MLYFTGEKREDWKTQGCVFNYVFLIFLVLIYRSGVVHKRKSYSFPGKFTFSFSLLCHKSGKPFSPASIN